MLSQSASGKVQGRTEEVSGCRASMCIIFSAASRPSCSFGLWSERKGMGESWA